VAGVFLCSAVRGHAAESAGEFLGRTYTNKAGATLLYRLLLPPKYDSKRSYPVILYLHGAAGRGDDNLKPLEWGPRIIGEALASGGHESFLVIPQCPRSETWSNIKSGGQPLPGPSLNLALELITNVLTREFSLDATRRYLTGVSMGGHAAWALLCQNTGVFAAGVPVCGGGNAGEVNDRNAKVPVWVFHSDDDHLVPVQQARAFVKAWRANGGEARYTEYTGLKHGSWKKAYTEPELYRWIFAQRRR
jgi:predicted peptidase